MKLSNFLLIFVFIFFSHQSFSQRKNDTLKTEKLIIIKQYSPTLNDAFKVKSKPSISDSISKSQKNVDYSIFSVPVASTFTPIKGTASSVKPEPLPYNYQNYARLGAGNFTNIIGQFYGSLLLDRYKKLNINFDHISSSGGIDDVFLDDDFLDTTLGLGVEASERFFNWDAGIDVNYKRYNWYGIDEQNLVVSPNSIQIFNTDISEIDPLQTYLGLKAYGKIEFNNSFFKSVHLEVQNFSDDYDSSENQINLESDFQFFVSEQDIDLGLDFEYLNGSFDQSFLQPNQGIDYGFITASVKPNTQFKLDEIILDLGFKASLLNDTELSETDFFIYPKLKASYMVSDEIMFYAGADGDLNQNSYRSIVNQNPFVSPTLFLQPTDNAFTGFAGINGKMGSLSYNFKAFYKQENDYAFFIENPDVTDFGVLTPTNNFEFSNSFNLFYDDLSTLGLNAEINYAAFDDFNVGLSAHYFNYSVDNLPEATYLPEFKVNANANYQINDKWYLHSTLFFVGERESLVLSNFPSNGNRFQAQTVDSFIDLNFGVEYQFSERLGFFVSGQNLLDDNYEQWRNFKVQGLQVLAGLSYQFDW